MPRFLTERDVRSLVGWDDMPEAVGIVERAYREKAAGRATCFPRATVQYPPDDGYYTDVTIRILPGIVPALGSAALRVYANHHAAPVTEPRHHHQETRPRQVRPEKGPTMTRLFMLVALVLLAAAAPATAQDAYPSRPIDVIVPFPPGGPLDTAMRIMQPALAAALGQPIVLQTKAGGGGALGMDFVAKAKPDGYTLAGSTTTTLTILTAMRSDVPYKPSDFAAIANAVTDLGVISASAKGPWKSIDELIADAKKTPGKYSYGSAGVGTVSHLMFEMFKQSFAVDIAHVPFQGSGPVKNAILGGHVQLAGSGISTMAPLVKGGDLVALVTTSPRRVAAFPGVPTMAEKGFPEASINISIALFAPARTPREIVARLQGAVEKALKDPRVVAAIEKTGMVIDYQDAATAQRAIDAESQVVLKIVNKLGLRK